MPKKKGSATAKGKLVWVSHGKSQESTAFLVLSNSNNNDDDKQESSTTTTDKAGDGSGVEGDGTMVYIQWEHRGDREYVHRDQILRDVVPTEGLGGSRRPRRTTAAASRPNYNDNYDDDDDDEEEEDDESATDKKKKIEKKKEEETGDESRRRRRRRSGSEKKTSLSIPLAKRPSGAVGLKSSSSKELTAPAEPKPKKEVPVASPTRPENTVTTTKPPAAAAPPRPRPPSPKVLFPQQKKKAPTATTEKKSSPPNNHDDDHHQQQQNRPVANTKKYGGKAKKKMRVAQKVIESTSNTNLFDTPDRPPVRDIHVNPQDISPLSDSSSHFEALSSSYSAENEEKRKKKSTIMDGLEKKKKNKMAVKSLSASDNKKQDKRDKKARVSRGATIKKENNNNNNNNNNNRNKNNKNRKRNNNNSVQLVTMGGGRNKKLRRVSLMGQQQQQLEAEAAVAAANSNDDPFAFIDTTTPAPLPSKTGRDRRSHRKKAVITDTKGTEQEKPSARESTRTVSTTQKRLDRKKLSFSGKDKKNIPPRSSADRPKNPTTKTQAAESGLDDDELEGKQEDNNRQTIDRKRKRRRELSPPHSPPGPSSRHEKNDESSPSIPSRSVRELEEKQKEEVEKETDMVKLEGRRQTSSSIASETMGRATLSENTSNKNTILVKKEKDEDVPTTNKNRKDTDTDLPAVAANTTLTTATILVEQQKNYKEDKAAIVASKTGGQADSETTATGSAEDCDGKQKAVAVVSADDCEEKQPFTVLSAGNLKDETLEKEDNIPAALEVDEANALDAAAASASATDATENCEAKQPLPASGTARLSNVKEKTLENEKKIPASFEVDEANALDASAAAATVTDATKEEGACNKREFNSTSSNDVQAHQGTPCLIDPIPKHRAGTGGEPGAETKSLRSKGPLGPKQAVTDSKLKASSILLDSGSKKASRMIGDKFDDESRRRTTQQSVSNAIHEASKSVNVLPSSPSDDVGAIIAKLITSQSETDIGEGPTNATTQQAPEDLPTQAQEEYPKAETSDAKPFSKVSIRVNDKTPPSAQPNDVPHQQTMRSSEKSAQIFISLSPPSSRSGVPSSSGPQTSDRGHNESRLKQTAETPQNTATTPDSKASTADFELATSTIAKSSSEIIAEIEEQENPRCRLSLKARRELETSSSSSDGSFRADRESDKDCLETTGGRQVSPSLNGASESFVTTNIVVRNDSSQANLRESTLCDRTIQVDRLQGLLQPDSTIEKLNLVRITFREGAGFDGSLQRLRRLHTIQLIECDVEEEDSKCLQQWLLALMAHTTTTLNKVFLDHTEAVDEDCIRNLMRRKDKRQLELALRCMKPPSDIFSFKSLSSLHLIDCPGTEEAVASAKLSVTMKSLFLWGALSQETAARFFQTALTPNHSLESLTISISGGADLVHLGLPQFLPNTSLKKLEIIVLGGVKNTTEEADKIVNSLTGSRLQRFSLATHRNVDALPCSDMVVKMLRSNQYLRFLRLFSHEWKKENHDGCLRVVRIS